MKKPEALTTAKWFIQDSVFENIVNLCCLIPGYDWHIWKDDGGNTLRLTTDKKMKIYLSYTAEKITDIYRYSTPRDIARVSCWALLSIDSAGIQNMWFLGNDDRLRFVTKTNGEFSNKLPLAAAGKNGVKTLRKVIGAIDSTEILEDENIAVATSWPPKLPLHKMIDPIIEELI